MTLACGIRVRQLVSSVSRMHVVPYRGANFGSGEARAAAAGQTSSLGRGQRYRENYADRVDHNRPPSLNLASLQQNFNSLWDRTKKKVNKGRYGYLPL